MIYKLENVVILIHMIKQDVNIQIKVKVVFINNVLTIREKKNVKVCLVMKQLILIKLKLIVFGLMENVQVVNHKEHKKLVVLMIKYQVV